MPWLTGRTRLKRDRVDREAQERAGNEPFAKPSREGRLLRKAARPGLDGQAFSNPRPSAAAPISAGRFMMTKPARSRCSTSRRATISAMISSALWTRLRLWNRSAKASADARSEGSAGVRLGRSP